MISRAALVIRALKCLSFPAIALIMIPIAAADPAPSVHALMTQPVSMFSFGVYRLREHLTSVYDDRRGLELKAPLSGRMPYGTLVRYNWDENRLQVTLLRYAPRDEGWDFEEECRQVLASLRRGAYVNLATGEPQDGIDHSAFADHFLPEGYSVPGIGPSTGRDIDGIIDLYFQAAHSRGSFICMGPLLGTGYAVLRTE